MRHPGNVFLVLVVLFALSAGISGPAWCQTPDPSPGTGSLILYVEGPPLPAFILSLDGGSEELFVKPSTRLELAISPGRHRLEMREAIGSPFLQRMSPAAGNSYPRLDALDFEIGQGETKIFAVSVTAGSLFGRSFILKPAQLGADEVRRQYPATRPGDLASWRLPASRWVIEIGYLPLFAEGSDISFLDPATAAVARKWTPKSGSTTMELGARLFGYFGDPELLLGGFARTKFMVPTLELGLLGRLRDADPDFLSDFELQYAFERVVPYFGGGAELPVRVSRDFTLVLSLDSFYLLDFRYTPGSVSDTISKALMLGLCFQNFKYAFGIRMEF